MDAAGDVDGGEVGELMELGVMFVSQSKVTESKALNFYFLPYLPRLSTKFINQRIPLLPLLCTQRN